LGDSLRGEGFGFGYGGESLRGWAYGVVNGCAVLVAAFDCDGLHGFCSLENGGDCHKCQEENEPAYNFAGGFV
jgi:hypothetical protein